MLATSNIETPAIQSCYYNAPANNGMVDLSPFVDAQRLRDFDRFPAQFPSYASHQQTSNMSQKRIVKVYIADPDARVPADKSLLYTGSEQFTDLTDQELFFEIDIKAALETHNAKRILIRDKDASQKFGKDMLLEPIKIRDLKMLVVNVAVF